MSNKEKVQFHKLTPAIVKEDFESYQVALDYAYREEDVLNIALTGTYGAGKSSIWKTYKRNKSWSAGECIQVSLADFRGGKLKASSPDEQVADSISQIEVQILNQILYQVDDSKIPNSKYQVKKPSNLKKTIKRLYPWVMLALFFFILFLDPIITELIKLYLNTRQIAWINVGLAVTLLLLPGLILIGRVLKYENVKLKKISFQGANVEVASEEQGSLFDRDLDEVVYIIRESGAHTIVFEDLDRFENIELFAKLRELNYLANTNSKKSIRFVYMIRDDIFLSKERTKFFDFVIPIVPIMDTHNAKGLFLKMFEPDMQMNFHPDQLIIERISSYIDEYRLLKNIYNEYSIYRRQIDVGGRSLDANKLLGMIIYKNIFPSDYEKLQVNQGYIFNLFERVDDLKKAVSAKLNDDIRHVQDKNYELRNWVIDSQAELLLLFFPIEEAVGISANYKNPLEAIKYIVENPDSNYQYRSFNMKGTITGKDIILKIEQNKEYQRRKALLVSSTIEEQIISNENLIRSYEEELNDVNSSNVSSLLLTLDKESVKLFFREETSIAEDTITEFSTGIIQNHYFPLIKYLIYNGILDETYSEYMGYFYPSSVSKNDSIFIRSIIEGNYLEPGYTLDDVNVIKSQLIIPDYNRPGILNFNLLNSILNQENEVEFSALIRMVDRKGELFFIEHYLTTASIESQRLFVEQLLRNLPNQIVKFIESNELTSQNKDDLVLFALDGKEATSDILSVNDKFKEYISKHPRIMESNHEIDHEKLFISLSELEIQFNDISSLNISKDFWQRIELNELFELSVGNVTSLIRALVNLDDETDEFILGNQLTILRTENVLARVYSCILESYSDYLLDYIFSISERDVFVTNIYQDLISVCNAEIPIESKVKYITNNKTEMTNLIDCKDEILWKTILGTGRIEQTVKNMLDYYSMKNNSIDDVLISYINRFDISSLKSGMEIIDDSALEDFLLTIINAPSLNEGILKVLSEKCSSEILELNDELNNSQIAILLESHCIAMNKGNLPIVASNIENFSVFIETRFVEFEVFFVDQEFIDYWEETDENILYTLIKRKRLLEEQLECLISHYGKSISIFDLETASNTIKKYIILNYFEMKDIDLIFESYKNFNYKEEFTSLFSEESNQLKLEGKNVPSDFVKDCLVSSSLTEEHKAKVICLSLRSNVRGDIKSWLTSFSPTKALSTIFEGKQPVISDELERRVAQALKAEGYVSISSSKEDERVYPRKKAREK